MNNHKQEVFEKIKSYEPYMDSKLNALVDLCELLNSGLIGEREYFNQREIILRGDNNSEQETENR